MADLTSYVSRLSQYYTIYGQCASAHCPKYRMRVSNNVEVILTEDGKTIVATIHCRLQNWNILEEVHAVLNKLYEAGAGTSCVHVGIAETQSSKSHVFGGK